MTLIIYLYLLIDLDLAFLFAYHGWEHRGGVIAATHILLEKDSYHGTA
jgi:hypothetical protein